MRRFSACFLGLILLFSLSGCSRQVTPRTEPEPALATEFISLLAAREYAKAAQMFGRELKSKLSTKSLEAVWESLNTELGGLKSVGEPHGEAVEEHQAVTIPLEFATAKVTARVVFDHTKAIAGLHFSPPQSTLPYTPPPYADSTKFVEREVSVGSPEWPLPGTLSLPTGQGPFPAVVIVHGSGPNDRDQTLGPNKPFRDIAHGLASHGIAVLRYDKRTLVHGARLNAAAVTPEDETIEDAVSAAQFLATLPEIDPERVFVLGHSLGGYLAPLIAEGFPAALGVIILAAPARPLEDIILDQYKYIYSLDGVLSSIEKQHLKELEAQVKRVKNPKLSPSTPPSLLPLKIPAPYWRYLREYDVLARAKALVQPLLILQGERDYQVTMEDFRRWQHLGKANATLKAYPYLNHLFMYSEGSGLSTPAEYAQPNHVAEEVVVDISKWITSR